MGARSWQGQSGVQPTRTVVPPPARLAMSWHAAMLQESCSNGVPQRGTHKTPGLRQQRGGAGEKAESGSSSRVDCYFIDSCLR